MLRQLKLVIAAAVFAAVSFGAARADTVSVSGNTFTNPAGTFNRPVEGGQSLSLLATNVAYSTYQFSVTLGGSYSFLSVSQEPFIYDPFLALYANSFNPSNGVANFVVANDDFQGSLIRSSFTTNLSTGVRYILVTSGHSNFDSGAFVNTVSGPGAFTAPIPEPATMLLLGSGLLGVAAKVRARRRRSS